MLSNYGRDDTKRRLSLTIADPVTVAELIASVEHQLADGTWLYGLILDARSVSRFVPKSTDMQMFVSRIRELVVAHGPRGPIAIVSKHAGVISSGEIYNFFGDRMEAVEVFWDMAEAQKFLDQQTALSS